MLFSLGLLCNIFAVSAVATPTDMTAVIQATTHGPLALSSHIPTPIPNATAEEVLIRVHYSALNRMDLLQAKGKYPLPPGTSDILGVEVSELFRPTLSLSQSLTHIHTHTTALPVSPSSVSVSLSLSQVAGVVVSAPPSSHLHTGDSVMALLPGGGYAEYCVCNARTGRHGVRRTAYVDTPH